MSLHVTFLKVLILLELRTLSGGRPLTVADPSVLGVLIHCVFKLSALATNSSFTAATGFCSQGCKLSKRFSRQLLPKLRCNAWEAVSAGTRPRPLSESLMRRPSRNAAYGKRTYQGIFRQRRGLSGRNNWRITNEQVRSLTIGLRSSKTIRPRETFSCLLVFNTDFEILQARFSSYVAR